MQLFSPFLFERLHKRKGAIIFFCFLFRFSIGMTAFIPLVFTSEEIRLGSMFLIYLIAFSAAGFVTPGLNNWIMQTAPQSGRGSYFAKKDIFASISNALLAMAMARQLDYFLTRGHAAVGYFLVFFTSLLLACIDVILLFGIHEKESGNPVKLTIRQMVIPLKESKFRKMILFLSIHSFFFNFSAPFLVVYQLKGLELSHTFISAMGVGAAIIGILGIILWGKIADRYSWNKAICYTGIGIAIGYLGWSLATPKTAWLLAPLMQCIVISCNSSFNIAGLNLQYFMSEGRHTIANLGITAAITNVCGYLAILISAGLHQWLEINYGFRSISILLFISAAGILCNAFSFNRKLKSAGDRN